MTSSANLANSHGTGIEWYPKGSNAFTAHAALANYIQPHVAGKRRKLLPIDRTATEEKQREQKNKRNRELMAAKRAAERINTPTGFNVPISPKGTPGDSALARAKAGI